MVASPMSSEVDPLLPKNETAPEISGYGFSKQKRSADVQESDGHGFLEQDNLDGDNGDGGSTSDDDSTSASSLSSVCGIFVFVLTFALFIAIVVPGPLGERWNQPKPEPVPRPPSPGTSIGERVAKILDDTPLIDGHNDLAIFLRYSKYRNRLHTPTFKDDFETGGMGAQVDIPRLKSGKVGGAFWSAFVACPSNSLDFSDKNYAKPASETLSQIDLLSRLQRLYPSIFTPAVSSPSTALAAFHANKSLVSPISIEGLHQLPQSAPMSTLRLYYSLGVRAATLTWNCHNAFADAALISDLKDGEWVTIPAPPFRGGLTKRGKEVITEMNRVGMLVDLSHTSYSTQVAVLSNGTSKAPVIYSHSSAFKLCPHPRNVHDDVLQLVKQTSSVVMINFSPGFITCLPPPNSSVLPEEYEKNNTLHQVARHITYIGDLIGYDHVGLGSDFDGMGDHVPRGLEDVEKYPDLVKELLEMGVKDDDVSKVVGGNVLRVWQKAEEVAARMRAEGIVEGEDEVEVPKWEEDLLK